MKKDLTFGGQARTKLLEGIEKIANAVGSTLGPLGNTVIIQDRNTTRGVRITKDGVTVANNMVDMVGDPIEGLAMTIVREAAESTAKSAGDGTTTSIVLAHAIIREGMTLLDEDPSINVTELVKDIRVRSEAVCKSLSEAAIPVTDDNMEDIAVVSCNNDTDLGKLVSDAYKAVGRDGVVTPKTSPTSETYYEITKGIKIDRGYTTPLFQTDRGTGECVLNDVYVLITDVVIDQTLDLEHILKVIIEQKKGLLIIGECSQAVINALGANVVHNKMKFCHIEKPSFGWKTKELMEDIAFGTGGTFFSETTGDDLSLINFSDLGFASRIIVDKERAVLMTSEDIDTSARVDELKDAMSNATKESDRAFYKERIAKLTGGVGVVYAGGDSVIEQKELFDRIEDSVRAVESAIEMGILPGGGIALRDNSFVPDSRTGQTGQIDIPKETKAGARLLNRALTSPYNKIFENGSLDPRSHIFEIGMGWDLKKNTYGNMIAMGVIDPAKVTINALRNAVSVATTILSTNAVISFNESNK